MTDRDRESRRRQIMDAVIDVTASGGLQSATFRTIADRAGVSVRLVQYYFGDKDQLLADTLAYVGAQVVDGSFERGNGAVPVTSRRGGEDLRAVPAARRASPARHASIHRVWDDPPHWSTGRDTGVPRPTQAERGAIWTCSGLIPIPMKRPVR
jgi:AcrR family transcriptional regulator